MRIPIKFILCAFVLPTYFVGIAQSTDSDKFAIKAYANIGLGNAVNQKSVLPVTDKTSSANEFGLDFGWMFWKQRNHSLEANIGLGYSTSAVESSLHDFTYSYSAAADADMDGEEYIRHYELEYMKQKSITNRLTVPVYLSYAFRCNSWLRIHADLGVNFGFKISSKLSDLTGEGYCYGVYPQYDDLKIDESYLNDFGRNEYSNSAAQTPEPTGFSCSILTGVGADFRIYGPLAADLSFRYNAGLTNLYKSKYTDLAAITSNNASITYTVKEGQSIKAFTDYLKSSKLSQFALNISLIYRF